jgi:hypothetical protein
MSEWWAEAPRNLQLFKIMMMDGTGLAKDALHVYAGLILLIGVRLGWRRRGGWVLGWLAALVVALAVEAIDMRAEDLGGRLQPDNAHWHDIWNTMFWPTVLLLVGPRLQPKPKVEEADETSGDFADEALHDPGKEAPPV